jgi:murein L,D-transpeptidase YcbB/YkuD
VHELFFMMSQGPRNMGCAFLKPRRRVAEAARAPMIEEEDMKRTALIVASMLVSALAVAPFAASAANAPATTTAAPPAKAASPHNHAMSRQRVEAIQQALNTNGEHVTVDGVWGSKTAAAVKDFQQKHGLQPTGHVNRATMEQLHVAQL